LRVYLFVFFVIACRHPTSTLFPYTTLFRSAVAWVMVLLQLFNVGFVGTGQQQVHAVVVVAVLRRAVDQALAQLLVGQPLEVIRQDRKSTRLNSSHVKISYAVFCLKKKNTDS